MFKLTSAVVAAGFLTLGVAVMPTTAAVASGHDESFTYHDQDPVMTRHYCGRAWTRTGTSSGRVQIDYAAAGAPDDYIHDIGTFEIHFVADDGSGDSWRIYGRRNTQVTPVQLDANTWKLTEQVTGRSWNLTSESGHLIWADRGLSRAITVFIDGEYSSDNIWDAGRIRWVDFSELDGIGCEMVAQAVAAG